MSDSLLWHQGCSWCAGGNVALLYTLGGVGKISWTIGVLRIGRQRATPLKIDHDIVPPEPRRDTCHVALAAIGQLEAIGGSVQLRDDGRLKASIPSILR